MREAGWALEGWPEALAPAGRWLCRALASGEPPRGEAFLFSERPRLSLRIEGERVLPGEGGWDAASIDAVARLALRDLFGEPEALAVAEALLARSPDLPTRAEIAEVMLGMGRVEQAAALLAPDVEASPLSALLWGRAELAAGRRETAREALLRVARDAPEPSLREHAARGLSELGDLPTLIELSLAEPDASARSGLACLLQETDAEAAHQALAAALGEGGERAERAAGILEQHLDPDSVDPLLAALDDPRPPARRHAAELLGKLDDLRAVPALTARLQDPEPPVRAAAAWALGDLAAGESTAPLIETTRDPDPAVRAFACRALAELRDPAAEPTLLALLAADDYAPARRWAAQALVELDGSAAEHPARAAACRAALADADPEVRGHAATALGRLRADDAIPVLLELLADPDDEVRWSAIDALAAASDRASCEQPLRELLRDPAVSTTVAQAALEALLAFGLAPGDLRSDLEHLAASAEREALRSMASQALARLG